MKKKILLTLIALLSIVSISAADKVQIGDLYYYLNETARTAEVAEFTYKGNIIIPSYVSSYEGYTYSVTSIGSRAFYRCTALTSITIPNSVTSIGEMAFYNCTALTSITIPNSVTSIGKNAFSADHSSYSRLTSVVWNAKNYTLSTYTESPFSRVSDNITSFTFGNEVETIPAYLCYGMSKLTAITIPESVTSIGDRAFNGCTSLTSITIPNSVTCIGDHAFNNTAWYNNQPDGVIYINKILYQYKGTMPQGTSISVKKGTTSISSYAFYECTGLTSITIPNSVTSIGSYAFYNCTGLTSVIIPNGVTSIGWGAFYKVPNIVYNGTATGSPWGARSVNGYVDGYLVYEDATKTTLLACYTTATGAITIPNSVTSIGSYAFYNCTGLTSITIPNSVTSIGSYAFDGCTGLTSITIPNSVTNIGRNAFDNTAWYNNQPDGVIYINKILYQYKGTMPQGTTIAVEEGTVSIAGRAFDGCTGLTSVTIPNSVTSIGKEAFYNCTGLTSITIPNSVTSIEDWAFYNVPNIVYNGTATGSPWGARSVNGYVDGYFVYADATKTTLLACSSAATGMITIPNSVTNIESYAFDGCTGLTSITIPNSVTNIESYAFDGCTGLTSITIPNSVTSIGRNAFNNTAWYNNQPDGVIYINKILYQYKGTMPQGTTIAIEEGTVSISGYAFYYCTGLTSVTIPESVMGIGNSAFRGCKGLTSVTIPNGVTSIGNYAFSNCTGLTSITIPNSVTSIGEWAFSYCTGLTSVTIPESVTSIEENAFRSCTGLTSVTVPNSVTSIGYGAFSNCTGLTSITIPNSVTSIGEWAFSYCTGLTSVTIPESVTSIEDNAFRSCTGQTSVTVPNSVTSIGYGAFSFCTGLTYIVIPNSVTSIERYAFRDCTALTSIQVKAKIPPQCDDNTFSNVPKDIPVYVACDKEEYQNSTGWSSFTDIIEYREYSAIVQSSANGSAEMLSYTCDNELTIQATANEHYHFTQWSDGNTDNLRTFVVFQDTILTAEFAIDQHSISASSENGSIEGAGIYDYGTTATLTAVADEHYHFVRWSDGNTDNPRSVSVEEDATYTAEFAIDRHTITTTCDIRYGEVTGDGVYDYGTRITLTAIPNSGYEFKQWSNGLTYNPYRFTVLEDLTLEAVFVSSAATALEDAPVDTNTPQKVLINGQVYILRNGKTYTTTGLEVK